MNERTSSDDQMAPAEAAPPARSLWPRRTWWFVGGFALVFVAMLLFVRTFAMAPSGDAVVSLSLWQYYFLEFRRLFAPVAPTGPASGGGAAVVETLVQHLLCSALGGLFFLGIGVAVERRKGRVDSDDN